MAKVRAREKARATGVGSVLTRGSLEWSVPNTHDGGMPALSSRHSSPCANGSDAALGTLSATTSASPTRHSAARATRFVTPSVRRALGRRLAVDPPPRGSGEQAFGICPCDRLSNIGGQLGEPAAVPGHDFTVPLPALVDPRVGTDQEAIAVPQEQPAPLGPEVSILGHVVTIGQLTPERREAVKPAFDALGWCVEAGMRPDHAGAGVAVEDAFEGKLVTVRVQVEPSGNRKINDPADHLAAGILANDVELADPAIRPPRELALDERQDFSIAKPGRAIGVGAIGADEGDYPHIRGAGGEKRS